MPVPSKKLAETLQCNIRSQNLQMQKFQEFFLPRISPVQEDETQPVSHFQYSPRSSRSIASPFGDLAGSLGSSSSSLLEDGRGYLQAPTPYNPSPPRHGKLRPVGRTQSAPLPLAHPSLLAPPELRPGKTSPDPDGHNT